MYLFGNSITRKVEKKKRIDGEIEVLKKQQKVNMEAVMKDYDEKKQAVVDSVDAQVVALKAQIETLETSKGTRCNLLDEERKVAIDKTVNDFNRKIVAKQNESKKIGYYIQAENQNIQDVITPDQPNAPQSRPQMGFRVLNEETEKPATKSTTKKSK